MRRGIAAVHKLAEEVVCLLAMDDVRERAVLPCDEHAAVSHHGQQGAGLALGEAKTGDGLRALVVQVSEVPAGGRWPAIVEVQVTGFPAPTFSLNRLPISGPIAGVGFKHGVLLPGTGSAL